MRPGAEVKWTGGLFAVQKHLDLAIHPGGRTALEMHGYGHNLPLSDARTVQLFGETGSLLPRWFRNHTWPERIEFTRTKLFPPSVGRDREPGFTEAQYPGYSITLSTPERAMMEMLFLVPQKASLDEAAQIVETMTGNRPEEVQRLLEVCNSIKVKRLFLYLGELFRHEWLKWVDTSKVDLGKGKRVIGTGGKFISKYNISVPKLEAQVFEG